MKTKKHQVIDALLAGEPAQAVAEHVGVSLSYVCKLKRWMGLTRGGGKSSTAAQRLARLVRWQNEVFLR